MGNICPGTEEEKMNDSARGEYEALERKENSNLSNVTSLAMVPSASKKSLRCYKQINVTSFRNNIKSIQSMVTKTGCGIIAVLKGDIIYK